MNELPVMGQNGVITLISGRGLTAIQRTTSYQDKSWGSPARRALCQLQQAAARPAMQVAVVVIGGSTNRSCYVSGHLDGTSDERIVGSWDYLRQDHAVGRRLG